MKKLLVILIPFISLMLFWSCTDSSDVSYTVLKGANIFDGQGNMMERGVIVIQDGSITSIGDVNTAIPAHAEVIDLTGKYIAPGLIDAHIHFFQTGFFDSRPDAADLRDSLPYEEVMAYQKTHPERYYEAYLRSGVTAVYDVGGFPWSIELQKTAENDLNAPHVAASGILLTPASKSRIATFNTASDSTMVHMESPEISRAITAQNSQLGSTGQKIWSMVPDDPAFREKINAVKEELKVQGNKMIVHATSLAQAKLALEMQAKVLVHSVQDQEVDDEFIDLILREKAVYSPTLIVGRGYYNTYRAINGDEFVIKDPNGVVDAKTKALLKGAAGFKQFLDAERLERRISGFEASLARRDSIMALNLKKLHEAGAIIAVATDAGNPGTLHGISIYDEMEAMQKAGIPAKDIIVMATRNGAIAMNRSDDLGTLEKGKMADLIIVEKDPAEDIANMRSITHVMRGGLLRSVKEKFD